MKLAPSPAVGLLLALALSYPAPSTQGDKSGQNEDLSQLYIVTHATSDAAPFWSYYILDVRASGHNSVVRYIRISPLSAYCPNVTTAKAVQQVASRATPRKLLGKLNPCTLKEGEVSSTIERFVQRRVVSTDEHPAYSTLVVQCGQAERIFRLPYWGTVDFKGLRKEAPRIAALWNLAYRVRERVFGKESPFDTSSATYDAELQKVGAEMVSELRSGAFNAGLSGEELSQILFEKYRGPVVISPDDHARLIDAERMPLSTYVPAVYPTLAKQARIEGQVELEIMVDRATGAPLEVRMISGHPLFEPAAVKAARQWKFDLSRTPEQPVRAILEFRIHCPGE